MEKGAFCNTSVLSYYFENGWNCLKALENISGTKFLVWVLDKIKNVQNAQKRDTKISKKHKGKFFYRKKKWIYPQLKMA